MHLGVLEGLLVSDARARYPELAARRYEDMLDSRMPGGGESVRDVAARVLPCIEDITRRHLVAAERSGEASSIAVVAHNTVNRLLLARAVGLGPEAFMRFRQCHAAINRIDIRAPTSERDPWSDAAIVYANADPSARREPV
jgi:broad specificity phosphatase PhoE